MRRLQTDQLQVGVPLPFSVYDEQRNLLLVKGVTLSSDRQIRSLVERGLYVDDSGSGGADSGPAGFGVNIKPRESTSPVEQLTRVRRELNSLLSRPPREVTDFPAHVLGLATRLQNVCQKDADCCLAALLNDREARYAVRHMVHVAIIAQIVAEGAGLDDSTRLSVIAAALTMNIAMLDLQDALHLKQRCDLSADQRAAIRAHPEMSRQTLAELGVDDPLWLELVRDHHECLDGSGYPRGISGRAVHPGAQIIGLADGYTARQERRPDRDAKSPGASLREIFLAGGKAVDPLLAALLVKRIGIYPPGLIVELENNEVAVVTRRSDNANTPEVHAILSPERTLYTRPVRRTTEKPPFVIRGQIPLDLVRVRFDPMQFWTTS